MEPPGNWAATRFNCCRAAGAVLCLVYRGVSLPLLWHDLGKKAIRPNKNVNGSFNKP